MTQCFQTSTKTTHLKNLKKQKNLETKQSLETQPEKDKETETKPLRRSERLRLKLNSK